MAELRPWIARALVRSLVWAVPGVVMTGQYLVLGAEPGPALLAYFVPWQVWALATPLVLALGRRLPPTRHTWWRRLPVHLVCNAAIAVAFVSLQYTCGRAAGYEPFVSYAAGEMIRPMAIKATVVQSLLYWGVIAADRGLAYQRRYRSAELERARLEHRLVEAQLETLRGQLRPHFLFNTLNAISVLMRKGDGAAAVRMVTGLGELLRRSLSSLTAEQVALRDELEFLAHYLDIQQVRFSDRLRVAVDAPADVLDLAVPSLLLQPLVENAIEHGVGPRASGGSITVTARRAGDRLRLEIEDDGVGLAPGHREGIGVGHLRQRLVQRYGPRHRFELAARDGGGTAVTVELPLDTAEVAA
jgi:signal transduction histidine kinase